MKELPSSFRKVVYRKPTNKEFIQQYNNWLKKKSIRGLLHQQKLENLNYLPNFSFLIPVTTINILHLETTLKNIKTVNYPDIEIIIGIVAENSKEHQLLQNKCLSLGIDLKLTQEAAINEVTAYNFAQRISVAEYSICIKPGDLVEPHSLTYIAKKIVKNPQLDIIYFDEGKVNSKGAKFSPHFKPKWSPDLLLSHNYLGNGICFRSTLFRSIGGFNTSITCSYLYDFSLRFTEKTDKIAHASEILFHKKTSLGSQNKIQEERKAIEEALKRRAEVAKVIVHDTRKGIYHIRYQINKYSKISIIIPSRDQGEILDNCLASIHKQTSYANYEIIIVNNGSTEKSFFDVVEKWKTSLNVELKLLTFDIPFNFSRLNNKAAEHATGDYLLFLNNDIEVLTPDWLTAMLEQAQRPSTGAIGAKLLFPNDKIQHAGIILGVDGISSHAFTKNTVAESHYYVNSIVNYTALTGACLMVKKSIFNDVKGFDEDFVIEFNDFDLCLKLVAAGYNNIYLPHVVLYHYESYSRGKKHKDLEGFMRYRNERSKFLARWGGYIKNDPSYNANLHKDSDQIFEPRLD